ncbi:MAG TPA: helicase-related protein [Acidimicrobiales bacterium]|nr:helicase-related protein [Acidimicrobiales bacterium]
MGELTTGALVEFTPQPGTYGVVTELLGNFATVKWDPGVDLAPKLNWKAGTLKRVCLPPMVMRAGTEEPGLLLELAADDPPRWKVQFLTGVKTVPEAGLRPNRNLDPIMKMKSGQIGSYKKFRLAAVTRHHRLAHLHDDLVSLGHTRVDVKPHQVGVVHKVVTNYPHRFLLCDEVGLGKTIEAGMVLKELRSRALAKRCLVIVPSNLRRQWQFELKSKFNESFSILDSDTVRFLEKAEGYKDNPFLRYDSVIVSEGWITQKQRAKQVREVDWDMVIVDEAHHVRSSRQGSTVRRTQLYDLVRELVDPTHAGKRAVLFLTATPMQLNTHELFSLVELLDPVLFASEQHFEQHQKEARGLSLLVEQLTMQGFPIPGEDPDVTVDRVGQWLGVPSVDLKKRLTHSTDDREAVCEELSGLHLLSEILIRNRKKKIGGFMPRRAWRWPVHLTEEEQRALLLVEDYVQHGFSLAELSRENAVGFVMVTFQKLMASSIRALTRSLAGRRERLLAKAEPIKASVGELEQWVDDKETAQLVAIANLHESEAALLEELVTALEALDVDSKSDEFIRRLRDLFDDEPNAKVLVFTEFRETQTYLRERLEAIDNHEVGVQVFHGQMKPNAKDEAVDAFRTGTGPQVLICTEAGGEGRNFQFCHYLVNYDLPWNPMRVEQRIGRVDRIGQEHVVDVFNLFTEGTIEEHVLDVLERRINAFEDTIGGLDPILGEAEGDIKAILKRAPADRDAAIEAFGEKLEEQVRNARAAEEKLKDFVMDTKSYSKEIVEKLTGADPRITPAEQAAFMTALLADARTFIKKSGDEFELTFHDPFRSDHHHEFFALSPKRWGVFHPDALRDAEHIEFFAFGHPIIETIVDDVLTDSYEGVAGTWRLTAGDDLQASSGWLFLHVVNTSGIRPRADLVPVFVRDDGTVADELGDKLLRRGAAFAKQDETDIPLDEVPLESLDDAGSVAEAHVLALVAQREADIAQEASQRVDRERDKVSAWFAHRERAALDKVDSTRATLARLRASTDEGQQRIIPVWEKNLETAEELVENLAHERDRRLADLEKHRQPVVDHQLVAVARVEVNAAAPVPL